MEDLRLIQFLSSVFLLCEVALLLLWGTVVQHALISFRVSGSSFVSENFEQFRTGGEEDLLERDHQHAVRKALRLGGDFDSDQIWISA